LKTQAKVPESDATNKENLSPNQKVSKVAIKELKIQALVGAVERYLIRMGKAVEDANPDTGLVEHADSDTLAVLHDSDVDSDADMELNY
jgi:hypothetical protein